MSKDYWAERQARIQDAITEKSIKDTERQLTKYYAHAQQEIIGQFEQTYNKLLTTVEEGYRPTPADLYKLDSYWKMQGQIAKELRDLNFHQGEIMNLKFIEQFQHIYEAIGEFDNLHYAEIDTKVVQAMISEIWCADGLTWNERIWNNTQLLHKALNDNLIDCVVAGKPATDLKILLQEQFGVSYRRADTLVRTELSHIQTQAARQRYTDAGLTQVEVWASKDERRCDICGKLHEKRYPIGGKMPIPAHPNCRCCILPVIE